nr:reverse transcriptase domain-containing protein [Tanacetum cinerariifolium]
MNNNHHQEPPPQNDPPPLVRPNGQAPRTMEELCQPSMNGQGGPIAPILIQATDFGLRHHMIQQDTSAIRDETSRNISSISTTEIPQVVRQLEMMNKNFSAMMTQFQMIKVVDTKCETCGGPHSFTECPAIGGYTQETAYATTGNYNSGAGPSVSPPSSSSKEVYREPETITDQVLTESTNNVPPLVIQPSPASTSFSTIYSSKMLEVTKDTVQPTGITEDVFVKVGKFHFPTDFVVVDYVVDPRVILILERPFLRTGRALIDVYGEELTLRVDDEAITFKVGQTSKYSYNDAESINRIDVIYVACEEYVQEGGYFILEEIKACLISESIPTGTDDTNLDLEGDIHLLEELLNNDPLLSPLPPKELNVEEIKNVKSSIDEPPELELKELPSHLEHAYLEGTDKLPMIIVKGLKENEKKALLKMDFLATLKSQLIPKTRKRPLSPVIMECLLIEECLLAFAMLLDISKVYDDTMLQRCEDTNLVLNWEKYHFMVKEGIILGHKIFKNGLEVDQAKVDVIAKLPHPNTIKGVRSFLDCIDAFETLKKKLTEAPILVVPDWNLPFELMYDASDFAIGTVLRQRDHQKLQLNELNELRDQAYDNSLIYKEKMKKLHDSKIKNHVFNFGDRVLLFNSRLKIFSGKLKTRWTRPFTIAHVFPYGTIELSQPDGRNFKVNGHRVKHYFRGDIPQLVVLDLQTFPMDQ